MQHSNKDKLRTIYHDLYVEFKMVHFDNAQVSFNDPDKHNCSIGGSHIRVSHLVIGLHTLH